MANDEIRSNQLPDLDETSPHALPWALVLAGVAQLGAVTAGEPLGDIEDAAAAVAEWAQEPSPATAEVTRRLGQVDGLAHITPAGMAGERDLGADPLHDDGQAFFAVTGLQVERGRRPFQICTCDGSDFQPREAIFELGYDHFQMRAVSNSNVIS